MFIKCKQTAADLRLAEQEKFVSDFKIWRYSCAMATPSNYGGTLKYRYNDNFVSIFRGIWVTVWHNFRTIIISEIWINISCDIVFWVSFSFKFPDIKTNDWCTKLGLIETLIHVNRHGPFLFSVCLLVVISSSKELLGSSNCIHYN